MPVRTLVCDAGRMDDRRRKRLMDQVSRPPVRSPLFWWFFENHDELVERLGAGRMSWTSLCPLFAEQRLFDARGQPPTIRTARETWRQARKAIASARLRASAPKGPPRQRGAPPSVSLPLVVVPPPSQAVVPTIPIPVRTSGWNLDDPKLTEEDRERMRATQEKLLGKIAKLDGRFRFGPG